MTPLRAQMIRTMELHRLTDKTQRAYLYHVSALARHYHRSPDRLTPSQIQDYLHYLLTERRLAWSSCNQTMSALVFFYLKVLTWDRVGLNLPPRKRPQKLPEVWPQAELVRLFESPGNLKHRVLLKTIYAAGLRVSEAVRLTIDDLDTDRMTCRVRQGKGHKDRDRIRVVQDDQVVFNFRNRRQGDQVRTMRLDGVSFLRRSLLHVLPHRLVRIRHYGFLDNRVRSANIKKLQKSAGRLTVAGRSHRLIRGHFIRSASLA